MVMVCTVMVGMVMVVIVMVAVVSVGIVRINTFFGRLTIEKTLLTFSLPLAQYGTGSNGRGKKTH